MLILIAVGLQIRPNGEHRIPAADGYDTPLGYAACHSKNFYKFLMGRLDTKAFGLKKTSRIKAFVFKFFASKAA